MTLRAFPLMLTLGALACASASQPPHEREPLEIPPVSEMSRVEQLGYELWVRDQLAWRATDAVGVEKLRQHAVEGWITQPFDNGWLVRFVGPCESFSCAYFDVFFPDGEGSISVQQPALAILRDRELAAWRARQLAAASEYRACTPAFNTVVIPYHHEGNEAWRVYLLAATTDPNLVILTGHHRFLVSADGTEILAHDQLSHSCVTLEANPKAEGLFVSHNLHPEPIETHVFTSLNYQMPLYVLTETGTYAVEGPRIRLVEEAAPDKKR